MPARAIDQHVIASGQPVVDFPRDAIGQAIGMPAQGKRALSVHLGELLRADTQRRLADRFRRAGDDPSHDAAATLGQAPARSIQQAVLARTGRPDEIDQPACHQNTLVACRHTCWTTGKPS
ncbi:hypothetical protein D3C86_1659350 [compost metagenome]